MSFLFLFLKFGILINILNFFTLNIFISFIFHSSYKYLNEYIIVTLHYVIFEDFNV